MKKIEIGSGKKRREGYVTCDIRELPGVDHVCRADELPFDTESIDEVYSRHLIEHLTLRGFIEALSEWNRVLKDGGELYIICPNLFWHMEQILRGTHESFYTKERGKNDRYWGFGSLFGWQENEIDVHKFGYYFELLKDILTDRGFGEVEDRTNSPGSLEHAPHHLEIYAKKVRTPEDYTKSKFFKHFDRSH